jgi:hypothetical protein
MKLGFPVNFLFRYCLFAILGHSANSAILHCCSGQAVAFRRGLGWNEDCWQIALRTWSQAYTQQGLRLQGLFGLLFINRILLLADRKKAVCSTRTLHHKVTAGSIAVQTQAKVAAGA